MAELWELSAHDLVTGYAAGEFTPLDALESVLARCDAVNPVINAVIARDDARSREMARDSAARWQAGARLSALDGVPISVKDNLLVAGLPATWGTPGLRDHVPTRDECPVARLRAGGAVLFAKTNVPELTVQGYTDNRLFGATGLPFAPDLTPGGSSGGAAAAVAAGIGPLALCTDGGGSIRRPAAHAGLYGFKPGAGRVPRGEGFPAILGAFEVVGPIGRDMRDIDTMSRWLAGSADPVKEAGPARVLHARRFSGQPVDQEIQQLCDRAADRVRALGHEVVSVESFDATAAIDRIWPVISCAGVAWLRQNDPRLADGFGPAVTAMADAGQGMSATDYAGALVGIEELRLAYREAMAGYDMLMTPAIAALSWPKAQSHPEEIDGQPVGPRGHAVFTAFANALGLPGLTLPAGWSEAGLACGIQLVGEPGADESLLQIGLQWAN
ncbi:amidase [Tropicimonas sediminicola]|uniref:Aspartyl-tRNA(Asn)/glutamyl-tRNA(Gln) amidotransferase subunit A n=1 Tax=Tropicimonas sediminicola TaxID=1031541 RepID=A0A239DHD3_9RHOB|nr:amidase [Tropicimonas sediminicola]SNS31757.1 aspartyl-tRNA(Asn)/glutamyl-tRNA(Gln) amidotransferase subunit A [Tropicimonas sediminicola]